MNERIAVYKPYDAENALLYVGISKEFGRRWREHASTKQWWTEARRMTVEWYDDEAEAVRAEVAAINAEHPRYNVAKTNAHYRSRRNTRPPLSQRYMGTGEVAAALGVGRQRAQQIVNGPGFPVPYDVLTAGKIWLTSQIKAWALANGRTLN